MYHSTSSALSEKEIKLIQWTLLTVLPLTGMAIDLITPSLPAMVISLHASISSVKNIITIYLLGYALGNFFIGFLTDAVGRKHLIRWSLFSFVLVSLIPIFIPNIVFLLLTRFLQGLAIGSTVVLIRATFADIFSPEKIVHMGILMGAMWGLGPIIGPALGGYLQFYFGWQAGFYFFAIAGFIIFIAAFIFIPETQINKTEFNMKVISKNVATVLGSKLFLALTLLMGISYSLIIVFQTLAPFLIQNTLHYSTIFFGHTALLMGCFYLAGTFVSRFLVIKLTIKQIYFYSIFLSLLVALISFILNVFIPDNIILIIVTSGLMFFACGLIFPLSMGKGISLFKSISGSAAAVMYLLNISVTSLISFFASMTNVDRFFPIIMINIILLLSCTLIYRLMIRSEAC